MVSKSQSDKILQTYFVVENFHLKNAELEEALLDGTCNGSKGKRNLQETIGLALVKNLKYLESSGPQIENGRSVSMSTSPLLPKGFSNQETSPMLI